MIIFKKILSVTLCQSAIYLFLFILIPSVPFLKTVDLIWIILAAIGTAVLSAVTIWFFCRQISYWFCTVFLMWGLILIYHPSDIYGISDGSFGLDFTPAYFDALVFSVGIFAIQCILVFISRLAAKHLKTGKKKNL